TFRKTVEGGGPELSVLSSFVVGGVDSSARAQGTQKLFADLREGKMTYPLIVGMSRDPKLVGLLEEAVLGSGDVPPSVGEQLLGSLRASGAIDAAHDKAREHAELGAAALNGLPEGKARSALEAVALVAANRRA
ncbi:MAG: hypothetical protein AAFZ18_37150, partial [Myxococcota bacterium]